MVWRNHCRYMYKFIVGGHWRHAHNLPTDMDQWGNINNVIQIGDVATSNFNNRSGPRMKVMHPLTYYQFTLVTFSYCSNRKWSSGERIPVVMLIMSYSSCSILYRTPRISRSSNDLWLKMSASRLRLQHAGWHFPSLRLLSKAKDDSRILCTLLSANECSFHYVWRNFSPEWAFSTSSLLSLSLWSRWAIMGLPSTTKI